MACIICGKAVEKDLPFFVVDSMVAIATGLIQQIDPLDRPRNYDVHDHCGDMLRDLYKKRTGLDLAIRTLSNSR